MSEDCNCEKDYITRDELKDEIGSYLKRILKPEYCPNCKELQNMFIIYHIEDYLKGLPPRITESLRCPGCLKLFENKLEEVQKHKETNTKESMGFGIAPIKELLKKTEKVKKEDENETEC